MKKKIIGILSAIFQAADTLLCKLHIKRPVVVVFMDGGICSQMLMYLQGQYYAEQQGIDVRYDTRWFDICGKDQFGNHPRIFEFTQMWQKLPFKTIKGWRLWIYCHFFKVGQLMNEVLPDPETITHSMYLYGYWDLPNEAYNRLWSAYFDIRMASVPAGGLRNYDKTIGIHVRRGDLAKGDNPIYGGVTDGYFLRAIEFCNEKFHPKKYIFFSDEPDWVEQNICNQLEQPYEIMRGNKAWEDLWLLAQCPVIVASQGSFGPVAAKLNPNAVLIQCDNEHANRDRKNTYFIK